MRGPAWSCDHIRHSLPSPCCHLPPSMHTHNVNNNMAVAATHHKGHSSDVTHCGPWQQCPTTRMHIPSYPQPMLPSSGLYIPTPDEMMGMSLPSPSMPSPLPHTFCTPMDASTAMLPAPLALLSMAMPRLPALCYLQAAFM